MKPTNGPLRFAFTAIVIIAGTAHAVAADRPRPTVLAKRGKLIVDDDGSRDRGGKTTAEFRNGIVLRAALGSWKRAEPKSNVWHSTWKQGMRHPPVAAYRGIDAKNLVVEVTFRFGEKTEAWHNQFLRIAADRRPQLRGHIVSAWANVSSRYTKTGFVLEHVGKRNKAAGTRGLLLDQQPINLRSDTWYTATLEIVDDEALFRLGDHVAYARAKQIRLPKNLVSLTLGTTWHEIKRVRIWHASKNPAWEANKAAVLKSRKPFTPRPRPQRD